MPKKVYNNVLDHRLLDGGAEVEDITSVILPTIEHPTTTFSASGMAGDIDIPNPAHVSSMELSISHNNGRNSELLSTPGNHNIEFRLARQVFDVATGEVRAQSTKYRVSCLHKSTTDGTVQTGNPLGATEKYSVTRFEKIENGKQVLLVDINAGKISQNGKSYTDDVQNLLK